MTTSTHQFDYNRRNSNTAPYSIPIKQQQLQQTQQHYPHFNNNHHQYLSYLTKQTSTMQLQSYPEHYNTQSYHTLHNSQLDSSSNGYHQQYTSINHHENQPSVQPVHNFGGNTQHQHQQLYQYNNPQQQQVETQQIQPHSQNPQQEAQEKHPQQHYPEDLSAIASPPLNGQTLPKLSREFVVRRISEGETGRVKEELRCEACGKGYKHISSLAKHLWEHTPEWNVTKKLLISKHQQVQLLEAASILVGMNHDMNGNANGDGRGLKGIRSTSVHGGPPASLKLLHRRGTSDQLANLPSPFSPTSEHDNNSNNFENGTTTTLSANGSDTIKLQQAQLPSGSAIHSDSDNHSEVDLDENGKTSTTHNNNNTFIHQYQKPDSYNNQNGSSEYQFNPHQPYSIVSQYASRNDIKQPTPISPAVHPQPSSSSPSSTSASSPPAPPRTLNGNSRNHYFITNQ